MTKEKPVLEFPCPFSIKAIGEDRDDYQQFVIDTLTSILGQLELHKITTRLSESNNYLAVSVPFVAQSREQLDAIVHALNQDFRTCYII